MDQLQWILTIAPAAVRVGRKYNYSIPALIGAASDETGYGTRPLVSLANNVLGMKKDLLPYESTTWDGETVTTETWEEVNGQPVKVQAVFRKYKSYEDCLEDFCRFMRYGRLSDGSIKYGDNVIGKSTNAVLAYLTGRYATDSGYGEKIAAIIDKWGLRKFEYAHTIPEPPVIEDRIALNASQVVQHNGNTHKYLAIHYRGTEGENPDLYGGGFGGHFDVTAKGKLAQAALVTDKIYHVGPGSAYKIIHPEARNSNTIGIECSTYTENGKWYFTEATQKAAAKLAAWLMFVLEIPDDHLLRHGDITTKHCPAPYMDFEGEGPNWTWDRFKMEVKMAKKEYIGLMPGSKGERVKWWQDGLLALGFADCGFYLPESNFANGEYGEHTTNFTARFQKYYGLTVDGCAGAESQAVMERELAKISVDSFNATVEDVLASADRTARKYKEKKYIWGSADIAPWLQPEIFKASCDRGLDESFSGAGVPLGNRETWMIVARLIELGGVKITDLKQVRAGDVVLLNSWHIFLAASGRDANGNYKRYDFGSTARMQSDQPFTEPIINFMFAIRPPYKNAEPAPEPKRERRKYTATIEQIRKGDYCPSVGILQSCLRADGFHYVKVDDDFGVNTDAAFRDWQGRRIAEGKPVGGADGKPDGICGRDSWMELLGVEVTALED